MASIFQADKNQNETLTNLIDYLVVFQVHRYNVMFLPVILHWKIMNTLRFVNEHRF